MLQRLAPIDPGLIPPEAAYETALRVIGRHLDLQGCRQTTLFETAGGFIARAVINDPRTPVALEFHAEELATLLQQARAGRGKGVRAELGSPLLPTGYEDFLRALGHDLDQRDAAGIFISELRNVMVVSGVEPGVVSGKPAFVPFEQLLRPNEIERMLDDAFHRRAASGGLFNKAPASRP
jgi:hypothetical protein